MNYKKLTPEEEQIIIHKGTEPPFSGEFLLNHAKGIYCCKRCGAGLYFSDDKFESGCGWPSFDDTIPRAIKYQKDADGRRVEILCRRCGAHLGHVFEGEGFTDKNIRHCVNSLSMDFVEEAEVAVAYFGSGCFWGTQYYMDMHEGVLFTRVGFMGGKTEHPSYEEVCTETTGHAEVVEVVYDKTRCSYESLIRLFFETHDFTQVNRQGPDVGTRYRSVIFIADDEQKQVAEKYLAILKEKGFSTATTLETQMPFWKAEDVHQQYYDKRGGRPYCHIYRKIFE